MRPVETLHKQLKSLDGKDYGACQSLLGEYSYPDFELYIDQIPKDPYAPPHTGIYRVRVNWTKSGFSPDMVSTAIRRIAFRDYLARRIFSESSRVSKRRGTGNSGIITISEPGQEVLDRSSVALGEDYIEARIFLGLPARNRNVDAETAETMVMMAGITAGTIYIWNVLDAYLFNKPLFTDDLGLKQRNSQLVSMKIWQGISGYPVLGISLGFSIDPISRRHYE
ncbi:ABC-ATPase domain-containing protein [Calditrichota bacterium]